MVWFTVWALLVVATLVGAFVLLRHLVRTGKALLSELGRAAATLEQLTARIAELDEVAAALESDRRRRDPFADPVRARAVRAASRVRREGRRELRSRRHHATIEGWRRYSR